MSHKHHREVLHDIVTSSNHLIKTEIKQDNKREDVIKTSEELGKTKPITAQEIEEKMKTTHQGNTG